jgi:3-keto-disaccharide hydrolase
MGENIIMKKLVATSIAMFAAALLTFQVVSTSAQQAGAQQGQPRGGGGRGPGIDALALDDHAGFESIFDGKTLKGWDGDPAFWRVENETIIGESTAEKKLSANTFLIWRGGQPKDFELKLEFRINSTNSGVQYRSVELPEAGKWVMKGYQADIDFQNTYTGQLYEEKGRGFLAMRGQMTRLQEGKKQVVANLSGGDDLKSLIKVNDWNQLHIIARGDSLTHVLNGRLMAAVIDDDAKNRAAGGLIGFQMHVGPPMKVEYRNIWLKNL